MRNFINVRDDFFVLKTRKASGKGTSSRNVIFRNVRCLTINMTRRRGPTAPERNCNSSGGLNLHSLYRVVRYLMYPNHYLGSKQQHLHVSSQIKN